MTGDPRVAHLLADEKVAFRDAESQAALSHLNAIGSESAFAAQASALRLELMRDLKQVNSHIVAASAYPLAGAHGRIAAEPPSGQRALSGSPFPRSLDLAGSLSCAWRFAKC